VANATVVIAPHFQTDPAKVCSGKRDRPEGGEAYWTCEGWKEGLAASNDPDATSFGVIDAFFTLLKAHFPALQGLTITGHSAGAQLAQRYAAGNRVEASLGAPVKYVIANPASYLYLDGRRLKRGVVCTEQADCAIDVTSFEAPYFDAGSCMQYDQYKYGLIGRQGYMAQITPEEIRTQYPRRNVTYLLGDLDAGPTTVALFAELDKSCAAMAQGPLGQSYRKQRGLTYAGYITLLFNARHVVHIVPGCGHSARCMFASPVARAAIFTP
jgi:hypothetical protein